MGEDKLVPANAPERERPRSRITQCAISRRVWGICPRRSHDCCFEITGNFAAS
jgi:hypothetical protein